MEQRPASSPLRWRIQVRGIVQGVGFRPFVFRCASGLGLAGWVRNDAAGVTIEAEGPPEALERLRTALREQAPPLARVDRLEVAAIAPVGERSFTIAPSPAGSAPATLIAPDSATCPDCLRELRDPADRRFGYPFLNCTSCGPRFTIVVAVPYDRANTTMAPFTLCPACSAEFHNPLDRRFHAQPTACPACGPQLQWRAGAEAHPAVARATSDPLGAAAAALAGGAIVAVKGLGGYHLACNAHDEAAVARLRARKRREARLFALLLPDLAVVRLLCDVDAQEAALLASPRRPIVLLRRRGDAPVAPAVAPGRDELGVMLPYTPLHELLVSAFATAVSADPGAASAVQTASVLRSSRERDALRPAALVLTSGNLSDEPIAYEDDDALARLAPIADGFLLHNRAILTRCDDSVARVAAGGPQLLRRSRGYAPEPLRLARPAPLPILAYGAQLKNTICLARDDMAVVSQHIGDLENLETLASLRVSAAHLGRMFAIAPAVVAYDLHPEYLATKEALASPCAQKIGVQHHHAHIASVLAEHGLDGPVIGVAADGTGYGADGALWGGEILLADLADYTRLGHLRYLRLPGGEQAIRQPWRVALSLLHDAFGADLLGLQLPCLATWDRATATLLLRMLERGVNSPPSSSLGRLFDGVAALIGLRGEALYEGQAAIELEQIAAAGADPYPFAIAPGAPFQLDARPATSAIVGELRAGVRPPEIAGRFHATVAAMLLAACRLARAQTGLATVCLSGGVFQNRLLLERLHQLLRDDGFQVFINRLVPPNDGGISLGQAAVAAARLRRMR